jgi:hypothetical protein
MDMEIETRDKVKGPIDTQAKVLLSLGAKWLTRVNTEIVNVSIALKLKIAISVNTVIS